MEAQAECRDDEFTYSLRKTNGADVVTDSSDTFTTMSSYIDSSGVYDFV